MSNELNREWFECLKSFSHLNGRERQCVIVGDNPDARIANFWFLSRILHNWPSQWHSRYKGGYIEFENWKKFDLANQTVAGRPALLFLVTPEIYIRWHRQTLENKIKGSVNDMVPNDRFAATQLIQEMADLEAYNQSYGRYWSVALLPALSVSQLKELAELFAMPCDEQKAAASLAAA
jgi:hypothetical protein